MNITAPTWLDAVLQQMAAECYFDGIDLRDADRVAEVLSSGNNDIRKPYFANLDKSNLPGKTRFSKEQIKRFTTDWAIVDQRADEDPRFAQIGIGNGTGFSATLFQNKATEEYTLSFRSTEYADESRGGDWQRDGIGADREIAKKGFAFGQIVAMEDYYSWLKRENILPAGAKLYVTGYSMGGHLATVFTELHVNDVEHTYNFNSPGRGRFDARSGSLQDLVDFFRAKLGGSVSATNVYSDARYVAALEATRQEFDTRGVALAPGEAGLLLSADIRISQLFGHATHGDTEWVANSGVHATNLEPIFIEDQPDVQGLVFESIEKIFRGIKNDFGTTHSITLIADSLALMNVVQTIDPDISISQMGAILASASNQRAVGFLGTQGKAEADSLEQVLQALHRLYVGSNADLPINENGGGFGNLANRNEFYDAIATLQSKVEEAGGGGVVNFVSESQFNSDNGEPIPAFLVPKGAGIDSDATQREGIAYRYALKELNSFAVLNDALYAGYTRAGGYAKGNLDLFDPTDPVGAITSEYIKDRAAFLERKLWFATGDQKSFDPTAVFDSNKPQSFANEQRSTDYRDLASGYEIRFGALYPSTRVYAFGRDDITDDLRGQGAEDHLYGGSGNDLLSGGQGDDYLEGGAGLDVYEFEAGDGNDTVLDTDGRGVLRYAYIDTSHHERRTVLADASLKLSDTQWQSADWQFTYIKQGADLLVSPNNEPGGLLLKNWHEGDFGIHLLDRAGAGAVALIQNGSNFDDNLSGQNDDPDADHVIYGATGRDVIYGALANNTLIGGADADILQSISGDDVLVADVLIDGELQATMQAAIYSDEVSPSDVREFLAASAGDDILIGGTGNDVLSGGLGLDTLLGGAGDDTIWGDTELSASDREWSIDSGYYHMTGYTPPAGQGGNDTIYAGGGNDHVSAEAGDDYVDAGSGDDQVIGHDGNDTIFGGAGDDVLAGDALPGDSAHPMAPSLHGDDYLDGENGNDVLIGNGGADLLFGGAGNDTLWGDDETAPEAYQGADYLDGEDGDDTLRGFGGDDELFGGAGDDTLNADKGDDYLDGEDGNDQMSGGEGADKLYGGAGDDKMRGEGGNDYLDGEEGADLVTGGDGNDSLLGGAGKDELQGGADNDSLDGGEGDDRLFGEAGNDSLLGGDGVDTLSGGEGNDALEGGSGNDQLFGGAGIDELNGGEGDDQLQGGAGNDTLQGAGGTDTVFGEAGDDVLTGGDGVDFMDGGEGNDFLAGDAGVDYLFGDLGDDQIFGGEAGDQLVGGLGNDYLGGDDGDDFLYGDSGADELVAGEGADQLVGGADDDQLSGGAGADLLFGQSGVDLLNGDEGDDELQGGGGNDTLTGGAGDDIVVGGAGDDTYVLNLGDGNDYLEDGEGDNHIRFGAGIGVSNLQLLSAANQYLAIQFSSQDNIVIRGGPGARIQDYTFADGTVLTQADITALASTPTGSDSHLYLGSSRNDYLVAPLANSVLYGAGGDDFLYAAGGSGRLYGGSGNDSLLGAEGNDVLYGGAGGDSLTGGYGNDTLSGGAGSDMLDGGSGNDIYMFSRGDGKDTLSEQNYAGNDINTIRFGDISAVDATFTHEASGDLLITMSNGTDAIDIKNWYTDPGSRIQQIIYTDGAVFDMSALNTLAQVRIVGQGSGAAITGTQYNDIIISTEGSGTIDGGSGDDAIQGSPGPNAYLLKLGMGKDTIVETGSGINTLLLGAGLKFTALTAGQKQDDLYLHFKGTRDGVVLEDYYTSNQVWRVTDAYGTSIALPDLIDRLHNQTGSSLVEQAMQDWITSTKNSVLSPELASGYVQTGPDTIEYSYSDTYASYRTIKGFRIVTQSSDGAVVQSVSEPETYESFVTTSTVRVSAGRFGPVVGNVDPPLLDYQQLDQFGNPRVVAVSTSPGRWTPLGNFPWGALPKSSAVGAENATLPSFEIARAQNLTRYVFNIEQINAGASDNRIVVVYGLTSVDAGAGNDIIDAGQGSSGPNFLYGGAGDDVVLGSNGDDVLIGGDGNDFLSGAGGNDTYYIVAEEAGVKIIDETLLDVQIRPDLGWGFGDTNIDSQSTDTVAFSPGVDPGDLTVSWGKFYPAQIPNNIRIDPRYLYRSLDLSWGSDRAVRVVIAPPENADIAAGLAAYPGASYGVEFFQFSDGTVLSIAQMAERAGIPPILQENLDNTINGASGDDTLLGFAGNDVIYGLDGSDLLIGGDGIDLVYGGPGDDHLSDAMPSGDREYSGNSLLDGGAGNDVLAPNDGERGQFIGGQNSFFLAGGSGDDFIDVGLSDYSSVIAFNRGDGQDVLENYEWGDVVSLGGGIAVTDLAFSRDDSDFIMRAGGGDSIRFVDAYSYFPPLKVQIVGNNSVDTYDLRRYFLYGGRLQEHRLSSSTDHAYGGDLAFQYARFGNADALSVSAIQNILGDPDFAASPQAFSDTSIPSNHEPVLSSPISDQITPEDSLFSFQLPDDTFIDPDAGDTLSYSTTLDDGTALPSWLNFNTDTRTFGGTPANEDVGTISLRVTATDAGGLLAWNTFKVTVANVNDTPVVSNPMTTQTAIEDAAFRFQIPAGTFSDVDAGDSLAYRATLADDSALPDWLSFDAAAGAFSGTPANNDVGVVAIRVVAIDGSNASASAIFNLTVINTNDAPVANADALSIAEGEFSKNLVPALLANDTDEDAGDSRIITAVSTLGTLGTVTFDSVTQSLLYSAAGARFDALAANEIMTDTFRYTLSDAAGASATAAVTETITGVNDAPVVTNSIADQGAIEDAAFSFVLPANTFTDVDAGDTLAYSATVANGDSLPAWVTFNPFTRSLGGTPINANVGTLSIRVTATDPHGLTASDIFDLTVANINDAPVLTGPIANQVATGDTAFLFQVPAYSFVDIDVGDTLTYEASLADGSGLPSWLAFNASIRNFSGTPGGADVGAITVKVSATDTGGLSASALFDLQVQPHSDLVLTGTAGADALTGKSGNDTLNGLAGADTMAGGYGNDTYYVDNAADRVTEFANQGVDTVFSSITYTLTANVENLVLTGSGKINGTGNALANNLIGNANNNTLSGGDGDDTLDGGAGGDTLIGGNGNDNYVVDSGADKIIEIANAGVDSVRSAISFTLGANLDNLILTGAANLSGTGNVLDNLLVGNPAANALAGGSGRDILQGLGGNDSLRNTSGNTLFDGGAGADAMTGGGGPELYIGGTGNDVITTGKGADIIALNAGDGQDLVSSNGTADKTLSLGGGLGYQNLSFSKSQKDLVLGLAGNDQVTFKNWYAGSGNRSVVNLQVITEVMSGYNPSGRDTLLDNKVENFDFAALANAFDAAGQVSGWALTNALLSAHLSGSDTAAIGGDLAYQYGKAGSLSGIGLASAQDVLNAPQFGSSAQTLRPIQDLQQGQIRLS